MSKRPPDEIRYAQESDEYTGRYVAVGFTGYGDYLIALTTLVSSMMPTIQDGSNRVENKDRKEELRAALNDADEVLSQFCKDTWD